MRVSDNNLIKKISNGDDSAFSVLLNRYLKPVYNFLFRLTNDSSTLDDLTQETFIKAWKNLSRFDQNKNFKAWIFAIAKNTAYDHFKKKKTLPFSMFYDSQGNNKLENITIEDHLSPNKILEKEEQANAFEKKLNQLPGPYKVILLMRYKDDFLLQEIADILGEPYNTIKSRHNRALLKLRRILEKI